MGKEQLKQTGKVVAAHALAIGTMNLVTTVFLHRGETHGTIAVSKPVREFSRAATWLLSGMKPREWVGVHRKHHANADQEGDPHSPVQNGRFGVPKVFLFNGLILYKRAAKELTPEDIPEHLQPDWKDRALYDKGELGQVVLFEFFKGVHKGNKNKAAGSMALHSLLVHDVFALSGGGAINAFQHRGKGRLLRTLIHKPEPFEDGTYTVNASPLASAVLFGEGYHDNHHNKQESLRFSDHWTDIGGIVAEKLIDWGLAEPGRGPRP